MFSFINSHLCHKLSVSLVCRYTFIILLSFGRNVPGKTDPMDGVEGIAEKASVRNYSIISSGSEHAFVLKLLAFHAIYLTSYRSKATYTRDYFVHTDDITFICWNFLAK